jgi:hypothetical protein
MNDVSWRRILEQADSRQPFGRDPDAPNSSAGAHHPEHASQQNVDWSSLEAELTHATQRSGQPAANSQPRPMRPRQPSPGQHATRLKMRMEQVSAQAAPHVHEQQGKSAKSSGARNLIAISLSLAVVGFAAYQLGERLPQGDGQDEASTAQLAGTAAFVSAGSSETKPEIRASGNRLDLRPSLASQSDWSAEQVAAAKATTTTASIDTSSVAAVLPDAPDGTLENGEDEALVLNRGRDILERGHISGARLIFEYLADRGSALGAFALAQTYDAKFISKHNLPADAADEALATKWYRQAAEITNAAAPETQ